MFPLVDADALPFLTVEQMVEVDRAMIEDFGVQLIQMMENAGRSLARVARTCFEAEAMRRVAVLAGTGGNGGGALVCARRLWNWGADVAVFVSAEDDRFTDVPRHQLDIVRRMGIPIAVGAPPRDEVNLVIDGVIGYSLRGDPRGAAAELIRWANMQPAPVLSLDVPSGMDATTGAVRDPAIRAAATLTLALPKKGLREPAVRSLVGGLYLADISVPPELYSRMGLDVGPVFAEDEVLRLW